MRFKTVVNKAVWKPDNGWSVYGTCTQDTGAGKSEAFEITCRYLISAVGQLHTAYMPEIPGLNEYRGKVVHTANWDEGERLEGRRVAVIGNGATGVQIVPLVASRAKHLTLFQRSPSWIIPRNSQALSRLQQILYYYVPIARRHFRSHILKDQDARHGMVVNEQVREMGALFSEEFLIHQLPLDSDLRAQLTPTYPFCCKRVLLSDDFYPAISQAHVTLETRQIQRITEDGVKVENAEMAFDLLIFATGFYAQSFLSHIEMIGKSRKVCSDRRHGFRAYKGVAVEDLPNFAMMYGPNTNLSHISVMLVIEAQARYISAMVRVVQDAAKVGSTLAICPKPRAVAHYNDALQARLKETVFAKYGCRSWYRAEDGVVTNNWPGTAIQYQRSLSVLKWDDYNITGSETYRRMKRGAQILGGPLESPPASVWAFFAWVGTMVFEFLALCKQSCLGTNHT